MKIQLIDAENPAQPKKGCGQAEFSVVRIMNVCVSVSSWYSCMDTLIPQQLLELVCQAPKQSSCHQYV